MHAHLAGDGIVIVSGVKFSVMELASHLLKSSHGARRQCVRRPCLAAEVSAIGCDIVLFEVEAADYMLANRQNESIQACTGSKSIG